MAKQTTLKYVGPSGGGVELPDGQRVKPGETFEVAAELADELLAQGREPAVDGEDPPPKGLPQFKISRRIS